MEPFFVMATSDVPAPMSTSTRFRWRIVGGMRTLMAAIGSRVKARISRPTSRRADCMESMTWRGRKVAMTVALAVLPRWPTRLFRGMSSSVYWIVL